MTQDHSIVESSIKAGRDVNIIYESKSMSNGYMSILNDIINKLSSINIEDDIMPNDQYKIFLPEDKLVYNDVIKYRDIFSIAKPYYAKVNDLYKELDQEKPGARSRILDSISRCYIDEKGKGLSSDNIIDNILAKLQSKVINSANNQQYIEQIEHCLCIILLDAFMRCSILERPV